MKNCQSCLDYIRSNDEGSLALASATFSILIRKWILQIKASEWITPYKDIINKIIFDIKSNISQNISVKDMANIAGLSERRFRQVFFDITGMPPKKYIDNVKICMAEELLKNTAFSIMHISEILGYSSQFHFCKNFKKSRNITPSQYRTCKILKTEFNETKSY